MNDSLKHLPQVGDVIAEREKVEAGFRDLHPPLTQRQAIIESQRCLYCHDAPCIEACPSDIDIPRFIREISEDNINGAAQTILEENILGGSCARVCPTEILCEQHCVRNHHAECQPVLIGRLQRYAIDHMHFAQHPFVRSADSGRHVAVVGAGPAGLSCAHRLATHGHRVTLYEARHKPGGLNEYGIARYKLVDDYAQKEIDFLLAIGGIEIRYGQRLGDNLDLDTLERHHDAVFLGLGLGDNRRLGLDDENAPGVATPGLLPATDYIRELRQSDDLLQLPLARRCVVIGAGNTAVDMAVQMARLGAEAVTLVYRRGVEAMAATAHEQEIARANGVRILTWARPEQVLLDHTGRLAGMRFERTELRDGNLAGTGETFEIGADAVFSAIGQCFDDHSLAEAGELARELGRIRVDGHFRTTRQGVYAGGDCIAPGEDLTVQAVQHGKLAAEAIHQDLMAQQEVA
ncbi:NAD(P)-dependent oxidoreductase [Kushneria aurantia]|uniref:dihydrouracil dehydrogenase (NAD(+)) n=1 Tax=Kushneria aurantia TaxID=504092 RepID=A0ABV6G5T5_9GAMM|nr:NAD(P)-dependent oxidoreductase [Kushneria aurantia]